ncbi:hypothetical protein PDN28_14500 [Bacillus cereus]|uniref:hypothetical protein n=1 Tax=Bacillus cereus group TaxID=86661 RepID=UPI0011BD069E|nr:hypothetical protein [Bacillus cereus]MDA2267106.1 hypothetical protein [Bacillus cereus]MDC7777753.1 hypothetical protein [Bacillus cereus]HDR8123586.1 hypothetical protein [Bacillus cereus]
MGIIEFKQTNGATIDASNNTTSSISLIKNVNDTRKEEKSELVKGQSVNSINEMKYGDKNNVSSFHVTNEIEKLTSKRNELLKRKILNMLKNENIEVGYTSMTEMFLNKMLKNDLSETKDIINLIYFDVFDKPKLLQKLVEVVSDLDYEKLSPLNKIIAVGVINHKDVGVQEAAIAAFEKWDDKENLKLLMNIQYTTPWIEDYAKEVIEYLEGC